MNGWTDYMVKQEQYRDQLREAENHRQIKRVLADRERSAIWQPIRSLVLGITKGKSVKVEVPCRECVRPLEKAA